MAHKGDMIQVSQDEEVIVDSDALLSRVSAAPRGRQSYAVVGLSLGAALLLAGGLHLRTPHSLQSVDAGGLVQASEEEAANKHCSDITGVILEQEDGKTDTLWPVCAAKWAEDCRKVGCCADPDMKCYEKDEKWAACNTECKEMDDQNHTWTCKVIWPEKPRTFETCTAACKASKTCHQAIYSADGQGDCKLSEKSSSNIVWAGDSVNSSVCDASKDKVTDTVAKVQDQLPFELIQPERDNCSWAGEDCSQTKCCKEYACTKDFSQCWGYSCYKKGDYFAGCMNGNPPESWNGTWIGGAQQYKVQPPAGANVKLMGTTLFCFMVVAWDAPPPKKFWSTERELVDNIKDYGLSVMQCDMHKFYDGIVTKKAEWGSFSNIDAFMDAWKLVEKDGDWQNYDWTVKVDSDAVFLPDRLKQHLDALRVPFGARVYLENNDYRFHFMGALEVISKPAMDIWMPERWNCIRGKHEGGEDFFMKGCMDSLGIDHMVDHALLSDTYAGQDVHCVDGWSAAYHFHKSVIRWNWCYNEVVCGSRRCEKGEGTDVEYVMEG